MRLICVGTGSSGNCYALDAGSEILLIEAGMRLMDVKKALDFRVGNIVGCLISHSHGDHAKWAKQYEAAGIPCWMPWRRGGKPRMGGFLAGAFDLVHDVPCYGFWVSHPDMGALAYASDTKYVKWTFPGVNHILVEANYMDGYIDKSAPNYRHVVDGHMEIGTTLEFLRANDSDRLMTVTLCHLSSLNGDAERFKAMAKGAVGCPVEVARPGLSLELSRADMPDWAAV